MQEQPSTPLAYSPPAAAARVGTNTRAIYTLMERGELRSFKLGKRRLIPESELQRLVERMLAQAERAGA